MPTVIDALFVEIGLDPRKFGEGRRQLDDELRKGREAVVSFGEGVERQGQKISEVFSFMKRGAAGILATFVGGEAAAFIERLGAMDASTMRLARSIGETTHELSVWQNMARSVGATAEDVNSTFAGLNDTFMGMVMAGQMPSPAFASLMGRAGVTPGMNASQALQHIMPAISGQDPQMQRFWLKSVPGMTDGMMNLLMAIMRDPEKMRHLREELEKIGVASDESAASAADLQAKTAELHTALDSLARTGFPVLTAIINALVAGLAALRGQTTDIETKSPMDFSGSHIVPGSFADRVWQSLTGSDAAPRTLRDLFGMGAAAAPGEGGGRATRGDRNNNPGNIEDGPWARAHGAVGTDGRFAVFPDKRTGNAAMAQLLHDRYQGLTLSQIQQRWVGNPDKGYLKSMSEATGLAPNAVPDLNDNEVVSKLMRGMRSGEGTHEGPVGGKQTSISIGEINVTSNEADPKKVAAAVPEAMSRYAMLAGANTGLV